jgi:2-polyprenyl-3-methyl-5-hydroxy-6-metoxy-1,4-benzoquinol methylase
MESASMSSLRHSASLPPDLPDLLEEKWGKREGWGSFRHWPEFLDERMALATPNLEILVDLLGDHLSLVGRKALDVGCGEGGLAKTLEERGSEVVGVELDLRNLTIAQAARLYNGLAPGAFVHGTGVHLPFTAVEAIEHMDRPESLVAEMFRVVRPGGHVLVTTPNLLQPYEPHARMLGIHWLPTSLRHGLGRVLGTRSDLSERLKLVDDLHYFSPESLTALLRGHAVSTVDLREAWFRRLLLRHGTGRATSDELPARLLDLVARLRPQHGPLPLLRLLLQLMPLKVLCRKGGDET